MGVSPTPGIDHHGPASSVRNDETEGDMMNLTAIAATLVHAAQDELRVAAIRRVLNQTIEYDYNRSFRIGYKDWKKYSRNWQDGK